MKIIKKTTITLTALIFVSYVLISWSFSSKVLFPISSLEKTKDDIKEYWGTTYEEELSKLPEPELFDVLSVDDLVLKGRFFQNTDSSSCAIIFSHGWGETWAGMLKYVPAFDSCNCDFVFYDHRVHGESEGSYATGSIYESKDLLSVTDWVIREKGYEPDQIGWIGSSWGASAALMAGAEEPDVAFIVVDAPFMNWYAAIFERAIRDYGNGIKLITNSVMQTAGWRAGVEPDLASPVKAAEKIKEPVLLFHSQADSATASFQSERIAEKLNDQSEFYLTKWGNDHVMDVINNTDDIRNMVTDFVRKHKPSFLTSELK